MDTFARIHVPVSTMQIVLTLMERALALRDGPYVFVMPICDMWVNCAGISSILLRHFTHVHLLVMPLILFSSIYVCIVVSDAAIHDAARERFN